MTTHTNKRLGIVFDTPESITVRQQLAFMSIVHDRDDAKERIEKEWEASIPLIRNWRCEWFPDPESFDLDDSAEDGRIMAAIMWVSQEVFSFVMRLDTLPKGSSPRPSNTPSAEESPPPN